MMSRKIDSVMWGQRNVHMYKPYNIMYPCDHNYIEIKVLYGTTHIKDTTLITMNTPHN